MNLNLIPADQQPTAIVAILRQNGALAADQAVQSIADANGDSVAALVVAKLPALVVADIVRGFDYSKPGIVGALLTPRQLLEAVERLPLVDDGKRPEGSASTICEVICGVILQLESRARGKYFRELGKSPIGLLALASVFPPVQFSSYVRHGRFTEDGPAVTEATIEVGNWQELTWSLRINAPQTFHKVSELVISAKRSGTDIEEELRRTARQRFVDELSPTDDPFA